MSFLQKELKEVGIFVIFIALMGWLVPILALTLGRGLEAQENFQKTVFYASIGTMFALAIIVMKFIRLFTKSPTIDSIIHDPEEGVLGKLASFKNQLFYGAIMFSIAGVFAAQQNTFLTGVIVQQQIAESATLALAVEPAVTTETMIILFLTSVIIVILNYLQSRKTLTPATKQLFKFTLVPFVTMAFWIAFHSFRYSASEINIFGVAMFGLISGFLIVFFNSFLIAYLLHFFNNLYQQANVMFSDGGILITTVVFLTIFLGSSIFWFLRNANKQSRDSFSA